MLSETPRGELKFLVDFINDVKVIGEMTKRYPPESAIGIALVAVEERMAEHFKTLDEFFGRKPVKKARK